MKLIMYISGWGLAIFSLALLGRGIYSLVMQESVWQLLVYIGASGGYSFMAQSQLKKAEELERNDDGR